MKLILAIIDKDDSAKVIDTLMHDGVTVTKLATTGGFLRAGNVTLLIGVDELRVDAVLKTIESYSRKRTQTVPHTTDSASLTDTFPGEVSVGGATVFVLDVERYEKL